MKLEPTWLTFVTKQAGHCVCMEVRKLGDDVPPRDDVWCRSILKVLVIPVNSLPVVMAFKIKVRRTPDRRSRTATTTRGFAPAL